MIKINLLGIGAAEIRFGNRRVLIDAYNKFNEAPEPERGDLLLFTHADDDHFLADRLTQAVYPETKIVGPPGIVHSLWKTDSISANQVQVFYPEERLNPVTWKWGNVKITVFQTTHYIGWEPPHISFLFEYHGKRLFFGGDMTPGKELLPFLKDLDALVLNLMREEVTKEMIDKKRGLFLILNNIMEVQNLFKPGHLIGNHVIGCDWTIPASELNRIITREGIEKITIPESPGQQVII